MAETKFSYEREEVLGTLALLKPFQKLSQQNFYLDAVITPLLAWVSLTALSLRNFDLTSVLLLVLSYLAFYRSQVFIHEVVHFQKKIKGLGPLYNLFFGFANRIPVYIHEPHQFHHLPTTFATCKDPEYMYLKGRGLSYLLFPFISALVLPPLLALRFGVIPLFYVFIPKGIRLYLYKHFSTVVVNPKYKRLPKNSNCLKAALVQDLACSAYFVLLMVSVAMNLLPLTFLGWWYGIAVAVTFVNILRARIAHRYDNQFDQLSPFAQIRDSVTVDKSIFSAFWAPLGLQYHSLHHLAPNIPYHNLAKAHAFLKSRLGLEHPYQKTILPTFTSGLHQFIRTVRR